MAQLAPQHQSEKLEAASWPLQLEGYLSNIKETFKLLSQELDVTRQQRDKYKSQLDAQAKKFDDFRKFVGLRALQVPGGAPFGNDDQTEFTASSTATSEYHSPLEEFGQSVVQGNQESDLDRSDMPAQPNPITDVFESAGSPLDDSNNNSTSEKLLDTKLVYTLREGNVRYVRFSPDGMYLATVFQDGVTKIYETETANNVFVLVDSYLADKYTDAEHSFKGLELRTVCFSPDNRYLATTGRDCKIRIWEIGKKGIRNIFKGQGESMYPLSLDFLSNGRFIASASGDSKVRVWNMRTGTPTIFKGSGDAIWSIRSSPDGRYIAAGTTDVVLIWDVRSTAMVKCSLEHPGWVNGVDFTQDGMRLVTGSSNGTLRLWDISSLKQQGLRGQQQSGTVDGVQCLRNFVDAGHVWTVAFSHDGQWVLSGSNGGGAYFWDTCSAKRQCLLQVPRISPFLVAFSPGGDYLAVGTSDQQVMVWTYQMI